MQKHYHDLIFRDKIIEDSAMNQVEMDTLGKRKNTAALSRWKNKND